MIQIRMSSSGYCSRRLSAMLLGRESASSPSWLMQSAEEGNWHEARLKEEMRQLGCQITDEQKELYLAGVGYESIGHIDGILALSSSLLSSPLFTIHYIDCSPKDIDFLPHLLEVKSFSFLEHQRWIAEGFDGYFKSYACQHTMYRNGLSEKGISFLASKDRSGGARNLYIIGKDLIPFEELTSKLAEVAKCAEQGDLTEREFDPSNLECRRCQFRKEICLTKLLQVDDAEVVLAAQDYLDGRAQEKEGKLLADGAHDILVAYAKRKQLNRWNVDAFIVSYSPFPRESVSIKGLLAIGIEREKFEDAINTSEIDRITVTNPNKED